MEASSAAASSGQTPEAAKESEASPAPFRAPNSSFSPEVGWTLISQGAEARLWKIPRFGRRRGLDASGGDDVPRNGSAEEDGVTAVAKERFSKRYRHPKLDERLTSQRCRMEARILQKCAKRPDLLRVPAVLAVEAPILYLEFVPFATLRQHLDDLLAGEPTVESQAHVPRESVMELATHVGRLVSNLHYGLGVVHGDLTTSNFLIDPMAGRAIGEESQCAGEDTGTSIETPTGLVQPQPSLHSAVTNTNPLVLIDFGLSKHTESAEERAVDLYVLERALLSTHPQVPDTFFDGILAAYGGGGVEGSGGDGKAGPSSSDRGPSAPSKMKATLARLEQVRLRGRKRECFG